MRKKLYDAYYAFNPQRQEDVLIIPNYGVITSVAGGKSRSISVCCSKEEILTSFWMFLDSQEYFNDSLNEGSMIRISIKRDLLSRIDKLLALGKQEKAQNSLRALYIPIVSHLEGYIQKMNYVKRKTRNN